MPLRTNWEHFITNTSHGPGLACPSPEKKKADEWEENRIKKEERRYMTDLLTSPPVAFSISKVSHLFWNPNLHQSAGKKQLISHWLTYFFSVYSHHQSSWAPSLTSSQQHSQEVADFDSAEHLSPLKAGHCSCHAPAQQCSSAPNSSHCIFLPYPLPSNKF